MRLPPVQIIFLFIFLSASCTKDELSYYEGEWMVTETNQQIVDGEIESSITAKFTLSLDAEGTGSITRTTSQDILWSEQDAGNNMSITLDPEQPMNTNLVFEIQANEKDYQLWETNQIVTVNSGEQQNFRIIWELERE